MPDKPTDKKLTFVEWLAKRECKNDIVRTEQTLEAVTNSIIYFETHDENCKDKHPKCTLCILETWLSEYRKYLKQK